ncbi:hypothetical protein SAMN04487857_1332 [Pseudomonas sp. ok272]|nr:DUF2345 domain-containing protein [Pseudomonas sp. ok602]SEN66188.1 hypothetical protein SAMN04487857_1332 [Pseudomonas sp. ok272]SFN46459.1 hypothetical protein SAMN04487858_1358 [Pseudomonas sp. ok602]
MFAARGPVEIQAKTDAMALTADEALTLESINGEITLNALQGITLVSRGAYIKLKDGSIEIGAPGELRIKNDNIAWGGSASLEQALGAMTLQDPVYKSPMQGGFQVKDAQTGAPKSCVEYRIETADGCVVSGVTDENGFTQHHYGLDLQRIKLIFK